MSPRGRPSLVLLYHRVAAPARDPHSLCVHPDRFAEQLERVSRAAEVVPLRAVRERRSERRVAVTFDDGYADNAEVAAPMLEAAGVPATMFVATDVLGGNEFWWDRLEHLLLDGEPGRTALELEIAGRSLRIDVRTPAGRARALRALNHRLRVLPGAAVEAALAEVGEQLGARAGPCESHRGMTAERVRDLVAGGLIDVGGHTRSHTMLSALSASDQAREIVGCRATLEALLGRPVDAFAYPYGTSASFDRGTGRRVRDAGFAFACTNLPGLVTPRTVPFRLPRHQVYNWDGDELARRIDSWFEEAEVV